MYPVFNVFLSAALKETRFFKTKWWAFANVLVLMLFFPIKKFIPINLPLLIIREGTQCKNVLPVHIFEDFGIDYIWQCNYVFTFIQQKDNGWLQRGGRNVFDFEVYLFTDSHQLAAGAGFNALFISPHVLESVDAMQFILQALNQQSWFLHACTQSHHSGAHFVFPPFM